MLKEIFLLIALTSFYILAIAILYLVISKIGVPGDRVILMAFIIFGLISGALVWAWPYDSVAYPNIYAMLLGDELYINAALYWGKPGSMNPHADIPWFLQVPQVYTFSAVILSGMVGGFLQVLYNNRMKRK